MSTTQFQEMYQAARQAMEQGDRARVRELAMQLLSMADSAWEKGEARTLLAWAGHGQLTASDAVSMSNGQSPTVRVTVVDFDMEFWSLVRLMVKAAIAAIPAVIILVFIAMAVAAVLGVVFGLSGFAS